MAGKTGTPQNWSDAWVVGYSPYFTTAVWFGFDRPGNSLGINLTGSTLAGPVWADYMREIHLGLPFRPFSRPNTGLVDATVCARSGLLMSPYCNRGAMNFTFLEGTQPERLCDSCGGRRGIDFTRRVELDPVRFDPGDVLRNLTMPVLDESILGEVSMGGRSQPAAWQPTIPRTTTSSFMPPPVQLSNPLLNAPQLEIPVIPEVTPTELPATIEVALGNPGGSAPAVDTPEANTSDAGTPDADTPEATPADDTPEVAGPGGGGLEPPTHNPFLD